MKKTTPSEPHTHPTTMPAPRESTANGELKAFRVFADHFHPANPRRELLKPYEMLRVYGR